MEKTRILAVAPYEGLQEVLVDEAKLRSAEIDLSIFVGDLSEGLGIARSQMEKGFDIILSRGGTAELLKENLPLPVVDIVPTVLDVLRLVRLARNMPYRRAIVAFPAIAGIAAKLFDLVEQDEEIHTIHNAQEAKTVIAKLKEQGVELILGDVIAVTTAQEMKLNAILIASGTESVQSAFSEAVRLQTVIADLGEREIIFRDVLDHSELNVVVFDKNEKMLYSNLSSDQMEFPRVFRAISECLRLVFSKGELRLTRKSKGYAWNIKGYRILQKSGELAIFYVEKKQLLPGSKANVVEYYHMLDDNDIARAEPIDSLGIMRNVLDSAEKLGKTLIPVLVSGEEGTPIAGIVKALYQSGQWSLHTILTVDCAIIDEIALRWLLECEDSPLSENQLNIYFANIDTLPEALLRLYMNYAKNTRLHKRSRILYSSRGNLSKGLKAFLEESGCAFLNLPSLHERTNDIPSLAALYLSTLNIETGRQTLGFTPEALTMLKENRWPGNHDELRRVIRQALVSSADEIITAANLKAAMFNERTSSPLTNGCVALDGTLEEINVRVVRAVLEEEGMNRTRAVERLGISRTTLWRMLK